MTEQTNLRHAPAISYGLGLAAAPRRDPAQELALLRKEVADVRRYTRGGFVLAAAAFLFAALAALFSAYTAYVTYTVIQALRDVAGQLS